jgi:hypothetical protein
MTAPGRTRDGIVTRTILSVAITPSPPQEAHGKSHT